MRVCCGSRRGRCVLFTNILDSLTVPCLVYNTAMYTVYSRCGQYGRCMVYTLAGAAGAWFIRTLITPIHYMYISDTIWVPCIPIGTRNCVNTLIHILYNFQTIWVQCISMRTQNCINARSLLVYSLHNLGRGTALTDAVADVISGLPSLNVKKIK